MNAQELNAPAVSLATLAAGAGTLAKYVPEAAGTIASIFGALLAYGLWKNSKLEKRKKIIDIEIAELELKRLKEEDE